MSLLRYCFLRDSVNLNIFVKGKVNSDMDANYTWTITDIVEEANNPLIEIDKTRVNASKFQICIQKNLFKFLW